MNYWLLMVLTVLLCVRGTRGCEAIVPGTEQGPTPSELRNLESLEPRYQRRCSRGNARACFRAALLQSRSKHQKPGERERLMSRACDLGSVDACVEQAMGSISSRLGIWICSAQNSNTRSAPDFSKEAEILKNACDRGHAFACYYLARVPKEARPAGGKYSPDRLLEGACRSGIISGCWIRGNELLKAGDARSLPILERTGDLGAIGAYTTIGDALLADHDLLNDSKAMKYYRRDCKREWAAACLKLGEQLWRDESRRKEALGFFELSCRPPHRTDGCHRLGMELLKQTDNPDAHERALIALEAGCNLDGQSCWTAGRHLTRDNATQMEILEAMPFLVKACGQYGIADGCLAVGLKSPYGFRDPTYGIYTFDDYLWSACQRGTARHCYQAGEGYLEGGSITVKNPRRAKECFQMACKNRTPEEPWTGLACKALDELSAP